MEGRSMAFCSNCGSEVVGGAKFCQKCGNPLSSSGSIYSERQQEFVGKVYKCPNCGEILRSFLRNCPSCGLELRGTKATSSVREFALKLEVIESRREPVKHVLLSSLLSQQHISKTDEQKINLIQSFSVPNTKEDMLEFMILATSNVNESKLDKFSGKISKGESALNDAWISKINQVYDKAKMSCGKDADFREIQELYDKSNTRINKTKKKILLKYILLFGWTPILCIVLFAIIEIKGPIAQRDEEARMAAIEQEANTALENGEYKKALLNAEGLIYKPSVQNNNTAELERQWNIKRELLIDEILEKAEKNGVELDYTPSSEESTDVETESVE